MGRGGQGKEPAEQRASSRFTRAQQVEIARMGTRIRNMRSQRPALEKAMAEYDEDFDPDAWTAVFTSGNPDDVNRAIQVTGGFGNLVNNLVELLRAGTLTSGLLPGTRPRIETVLENVRDDKGLRVKQVELLEEMYTLRGRLQHASPDVTAEEVHEYVLLLMEHFPAMLDNTLKWLARRGIEFE